MASSGAGAASLAGHSLKILGLFGFLGQLQEFGRKYWKILRFLGQYSIFGDFGWFSLENQRKTDQNPPKRFGFPPILIWFCLVRLRPEWLDRWACLWLPSLSAELGRSGWLSGGLASKSWPEPAGWACWAVGLVRCGWAPSRLAGCAWVYSEYTQAVRVYSSIFKVHWEFGREYARSVFRVRRACGQSMLLKYQNKI